MRVAQGRTIGIKMCYNKELPEKYLSIRLHQSQELSEQRNVTIRERRNKKSFRIETKKLELLLRIVELLIKNWNTKIHKL